MGAIHGDERLGPTIILEFVDYLILNRERNPFANHLLQDRMFVLLPITNANGYKNNWREGKPQKIFI